MMDTSLPAPLVNPQTGDKLWFETLPHNENDPVVFRCEIPAGSPGAPLHFHKHTDEWFECVEGTLSMRIGTRDITLAPGQRVEIPRGTPHRFWNASSASVTFRSCATPGAAFERFLRTVYGLGRDGRSGKSGMPANPLQVAVIRELADLYFVGLPLVVQSAVFNALSAAANTLGVRKNLSAYWERAS